MNVTAVDEIPDQTISLYEAWALYRDAFADLDSRAVQRHLMYPEEFDAVMADKRVLKFVCIDDTGRLVGLATYTDDLDAAPLISSAYCLRRWPAHYHEGRIWQVGFLAVADGADVTVFPELIRAMHKVSGPSAITILDVCAVNCSTEDGQRNLPRSVGVLLDRIAGGVQVERLDEQSYWAYRFSPDHVGG